MMHLNLLEQYLIARQKWSRMKCENYENYTETDITIFIFGSNTILSYDNQYKPNRLQLFNIFLSKQLIN